MWGLFLMQFLLATNARDILLRPVSRGQWSCLLESIQSVPLKLTPPLLPPTCVLGFLSTLYKQQYNQVRVSLIDLKRMMLLVEDDGDDVENG